MRRGEKARGRYVVMYRVATDHAFRAGFIVSKSVGNAVMRNRVKRRLRALAAVVLTEGDVVVRALPRAADASWQALSLEIADLARRLEH